MKYGYVYVSVSVAIVAIGIFTMYYLNQASVTTYVGVPVNNTLVGILLNETQRAAAVKQCIFEAQESISFPNQESENNYIENCKKIKFPPRENSITISLGKEINYSQVFKPQLSDHQVAEIIRSDLTAHIRNYDHAIIYGVDPIPHRPDFPKHYLDVMYITSDGTQFAINTTNNSIVGKCHNNENNVCRIHEKSALDASSDRLVFVAGLEWYPTRATKGDYFSTYYLVDAHTGDVVFSSLLRVINGTNEASEYNP